tara:strand:- start:11101 stop:11259 length:159 start_codon:yes stop_codon:yes gene_type:complete
MTLSCDNCDWTGNEANEISDLSLRVDPGGEVPEGECPECGALAYLTDNTEDN